MLVPGRLTSAELRAMALRQQQQIDSQHQLLATKEQRLRFLKQQEVRNAVANAEGERLRRLRERVEAQESKLRRLRALRGQVDLQKTYNVTLTKPLTIRKQPLSEQPRLKSSSNITKPQVNNKISRKLDHNSANNYLFNERRSNNNELSSETNSEANQRHNILLTIQSQQQQQQQVLVLVENGACLFAATLSDHETPAEKCEEDEEGFDGCSEYLVQPSQSIQEKLGILHNGEVYAVFSYEAQNSDELTFNVNDHLVILRKGDDAESEWWWAKNEQNEEGYVPRNLLGLYPRVPPQTTNYTD
ncbi:Apoptosis-stimulating of p53 protein 1 [Lucilia cuprina]|nr:Apoptosis-stimulating of p53 protein 1 [Lucilia cuprina]